jgi:protein-tyrosine-phosphatase
MKGWLIAPLALAGLLVAAVSGSSWGGPQGEAPDDARVVFVCENGVAMSVWSAAYFNRLAAERGLRERAISRASTPSYRDVPLRMVFALALERYRLHGYRPRVISASDARGARLVVLIDTALPPAAADQAIATDSWDGFPPMRERYLASRRALAGRVEALIERLAAARTIRSRRSGRRSTAGSEPRAARSRGRRSSRAG